MRLFYEIWWDWYNGIIMGFNTNKIMGFDGRIFGKIHETHRGSSSEVNHLGFADDLYFLNQKTTTWGICREYVHKQIQALDDGWWVWKWEVDPPQMAKHHVFGVVTLFSDKATC